MVFPDSISGIVRTIKAYTIYRPDHQPVPSSGIVQMRDLGIDAIQNGFPGQDLIVSPHPPRRDDFGFISLDEAHAEFQSLQSKQRFGVHILHMTQVDLRTFLGGKPANEYVLALSKPTGLFDPSGHLLSTRPGWISPEEWFADQKTNGLELTKDSLILGISPLMRQNIVARISRNQLL